MIFNIDSKLNQYIADASRFFEKEDLEYYDNHHALGYGGIYLGEVKYVDELPEENVFKLLEQFTKGTVNEIFSFYDGGIEAYCS